MLTSSRELMNSILERLSLNMGDTVKLEHRQNIRNAYRKYGPLLEKGMRLSPYDLGIDWMGKMSPIEEKVWADIRYLGLPLYPQVPVLGYFIDFGDFKNKIGIEVDSDKWHKNKEKDGQRQREIENEGWTIHRIPSRKTGKNWNDYRDENENFIQEKMDEYIEESSEGFLVNLYKNISYRELLMDKQLNSGIKQ